MIIDLAQSPPGRVSRFVDFTTTASDETLATALSLTTAEMKDGDIWVLIRCKTGTLHIRFDGGVSTSNALHLAGASDDALILSGEHVARCRVSNVSTCVAIIARRDFRPA